MQSSVQDLLSFCSPAAIAGFVALVIVDAVNAVLQRRLATHISKKNGVIIPSWIDCDATARIVNTGEIAAALSHHGPRFILRGLVCLAVFCQSRTLPFAEPVKTRTSAISSSAFRQMTGMNRLFLPTLAATAVVGNTVARAVAKPYDSPTIKMLTGHQIGHGRLHLALYGTGAPP